MSDRALFLVLTAAVALIVGAYFYNPLGTASADPRLRLLGYAPYRHPSHSMDPTMKPDGFIIAAAWPYARRDPKPGEIIIFRSPEDPSVLFVQRVIAVGGSRIEIRKGVLLIDGVPVPEPYVTAERATTPYAQTLDPLVVPAGHFFVMGDNRDDSRDSRIWGFLRRDAVVGKIDP